MKSFTIILLCLVALLTTAYCWPRIRLRLRRVRLPPVRLPRIRFSPVNRYYTTTATGRVLCENRPLKHVKVKLKDRDTTTNDIFGETRTDDNGRFTVSGKAKDLTGTPDPFTEVFLEYSGRYGNMEVKNNHKLFKRTTRCTKSLTRSYERNINFGDLVCESSLQCRAYETFYEVLKEYSERTGGKPLPYNCLNVITHAYVHFGSPYAQRHTVKLPTEKKYVFDMETARHEFGHTIRHTLVRRT